MVKEGEKSLLIQERVIPEPDAKAEPEFRDAERSVLAEDIAEIKIGYFGRDWLSARVGAVHRPVALVAFAHDAETETALFEAIVAVRTPMSQEEQERPSFLGKLPATLEDVAGHELDTARVADAIVDAYVAIATSSVTESSAPSSLASSLLAADPAWSATISR